MLRGLRQLAPGDRREALRLARRGRRHSDPAVAAIVGAWSDAWLDEFTPLKRASVLILLGGVPVLGAALGPPLMIGGAVFAMTLIAAFLATWLAATRVNGARS